MCMCMKGHASHKRTVLLSIHTARSLRHDKNEDVKKKIKESLGYIHHQIKMHKFLRVPAGQRKVPAHKIDISLPRKHKR